MTRKVAEVLITGMLIAMSGQHAPCQTSSVEPSTPPPTSAASPQQMPAYEVATIKPAGAKGFAIPLRTYIQAAFGIPVSSTGQLIGPDWINNARYVIDGKPPDSIQKAMQSMTAEEKGKQRRLMMQSLLADRFKLKTHFETRVMPVYQLRVAKGGPKLKEDSKANQGQYGQYAVGASGMRGIGMPMRVFCDLLGGVPDIGGRAVVDKTGLSGTYDLSLKWTPMGAAAPFGGLNGTAPAPDADGASLFTALEEQLGLKLVSTKGPVQVLVIDHIERPSEN